MKVLVLLRHAKAEQPGSRRDSERALAPRGRRDAPAAGRELAARGLRPDVVVSSPAVRALQTAQAAISAADLALEPVLEPEIYEASVEQLLAVVQQLPESAKSALLVGHNPGFEELLGLLTADGLPAMPTAALACLQLAVDDWQASARKCATIEWAWSPERGE